MVFPSKSTRFFELVHAICIFTLLLHQLILSKTSWWVSVVIENQGYRYTITDKNLINNQSTDHEVLTGVDVIDCYLF